MQFESLNRWAAVTRRVLALSAPYFRSEERWRARGLLAAIVLLNLGAVYMLVQINAWNRLFFDALQNKDQAVFWQQLLRFMVLACAFVGIAVYKFYITQLLELRWRAWMTRHYLDRWLGSHAFYRMELARFGREGSPDNPDQRIQEDLNLFTTYSVSLSMGLLNAAVTLASFVGILWSLSGAFAFEVAGRSWQVPGFLVWATVAYCAAGSVLTHYIGRPQIALNFQQQRLEADFRHHMVRVREYSEAIALDRGAGVERGHLELRFTRVLANYLQLIRKQKNLTWFTTFFGQAAVVFPYIMAAPRFFSGAIQLGELMQIASAFAQVQDSLSWLVDNYNNVATWRATADRLSSFEESVQAGESQAQGAQLAQGPGLAVQGLAIALPGGRPLLAGANAQAAAGNTVVLRGPSGSGKSTLLRVFAGIWPFARGDVERPADVMLVPQNPYFPDGALRDALAYPEPASRYSREQMEHALSQALLPQLAARLDDEDAWTQKLSGGERQRLALARVFLKRPAWVLADEATSALDGPAEATLHERLLALVRERGGGLLSIAHRPAVEAFHDRRWTLEPAESGAAAPWRLREG